MAAKLIKEKPLTKEDMKEKVETKKMFIEAWKVQRVEYVEQQKKYAEKVKNYRDQLCTISDDDGKKKLEGLIEAFEKEIKRSKETVEGGDEKVKLAELEILDLKETRDKEIKQTQNKKHLEACNKAMKKNACADQRIVQGVMFGFPRSGKSSLRDRLAGKIRTINGSTGAAESVARVEITQCQWQVSEQIWRELDNLNSETAAVVGKLQHAFPPSLSTTQSTQSTEPLPANKKKGLMKKLFKSPKKTPKYAYSLEVISSSLESITLEEFNSYMEETWTLYMSDTGGQPEFQELLPVLVSGPALFFLVLRLDKSLDQKYTMEYIHPETGESILPFDGSFLMSEMILQSLASVSSTRMQSQSADDLTPKILFVGTHKDQLKSQEELSKIDAELQRIVKTTEAFREGMVVFASESQLLHAVNNTSEDDDDFQKVRATVEKIAQSPFYRISTPFSWLMLGILLSRSDKRVMSYKECQEMGNQCGIKSADDLDRALWFLHHRVGTIRYFHSVPALQDVIIKDPQYIFDKVTELIVDTFTFKKAAKFSNAIDDFQKKGIFSRTIFEQISTGKAMLTCSKLITLLEHLHIVAPIHEDGAVTKYFLPCALTHAILPPDSEENSKVLPLLITFNSGYCPKGVFGSLVVRLMSEIKREFTWELEQDKIYRNQVQMVVGPYDSFRFRLHSRYIRIDLMSSLRERQGLTVGRVCCHVRQCAYESVERVIEALNYSIKASPLFGFQVIATDSDIPPATLILQNGVPVSMKDTETGKRIPLPDGHQYWFYETHDLSADEDISSQACSKSEESDNGQVSAPYKIVESDWSSICGYLKKLDRDQIKHLGGVLGLSPYNFDKMQSLPGDMVTAWLRKQDQVIQKSGDTLTWNVLMHGLQEIGQTGIAEEINKDKIFPNKC